VRESTILIIKVKHEPTKLLAGMHVSKVHSLRFYWEGVTEIIDDETLDKLTYDIDKLLSSVLTVRKN